MKNNMRIFLLIISLLLCACQTLPPPKAEPAALQDIENIKADLKNKLQEKYFVRGGVHKKLMAEAKRGLFGLGQAEMPQERQHEENQNNAGQQQELLQMLKNNGLGGLSEDQKAAAYYLLELGVPAYSATDGQSELKTYGIDYEASPLLRQTAAIYVLVEKFENTPWGQKAFIDLLNSPAETDYDKESMFINIPPHHCFAEVVVVVVPQFLDDYPDTGYRLEALYSLGRAYETLWSLSMATANELGAMGMGYSVAGSGYFAGMGPEARDKAISIYEEIKAGYPSSMEARYVSYLLQDIKNLKDTRARAYFK